MHVAFLTLEYPPLRSGGIGTSIRNLARALVRGGHRVSVLGWGHEADFNDHGVSVRFRSHRTLPRTAWLAERFFLQQRIRHLVAHERLDIVESHDWCGPSAGLRVGCPIVVRCNGSATYFGDLLHEPARPSVRIAERLAIRGADAVGAVSRFTASSTSRLFGIRRPIEIVPNGVEVNDFLPGAPGDVNPWSVLYVGTIVRKKGIIDLCRAFSTVAAAVPDARLVVVGRDSPDRLTGTPSTWALAARELTPAAADRVTLIGPQPNERVRDFVRQAAVCAFPSHAEALPVAWLEAMACARPIVAYDIGWAPEIVEPGRTGFLAPHGDVEALSQALIRVLQNPSLGTALGNAGRAVVQERFSSEVAAARTVEWYRGVLAS